MSSVYKARDVFAPVGGAGFRPLYKYYALAVLTSVYLVNFLDRILMGLVLEPIKHELNLSDTQLGFLTGIAFALFYATLGLPVARWADRGNRVTIASLAIGLWGITMTACLFVGGFYQLLLARVCAAVGEAGCMPPSYSLVGDYFAGAAERARAMAIYLSGGALSAVVGFIGGGWLNASFGWRIAFAAIGALGLALALLMRFTVVEPRQSSGHGGPAVQPLPPLRLVLYSLWKRRSVRLLSSALVLTHVVGLGLSPWYAAFLMRSHGMDTAEVGLWFALIFGLGGVAGAWLGGYLAGGPLHNDEPTQMRLNACAIAFLVPCYAAFLLASDKLTSLAALVPIAMVFGVFLGSSFSLLQRLVADDVRATTMAAVYLLINLIGMGLGPQLTGMLSDFLSPRMGLDSLRYAMLLVSCAAFSAAYFFLKVAQTIRQDLSPLATREPVTDAI